MALGVGLAEEPPPETIASGVDIDGLSLGGKTREEAGRALHDLAERKLLTPLLLQSGKLSVKTNAMQLGGRCDTEAALDAVCAVGRTESLLGRLRERVNLGGGGSSIPLAVTFDMKSFARRMRRLARRIERSPVEPRAREKDGAIVVTPGRPGRLVDEAAMAERVAAALSTEPARREVAESVATGRTLAEWASGAHPLTLNLLLRSAAPRVTPEDGAQVQTLLASFSTSFSLRDRNRVHNIHLAAGTIDGLILLPGDRFSYNGTVGHRTRRAGYRTAPEIVQGELVPGIGGGVCQVSSTVYNVALLADMEITRRTHHRFPVHYLPAGRDATVSDGGLDLRFRNRLEAPVALLLSVKGTRIHARIFGAESCKRTVKLLTQRLRPAYTKSGGRRVALVRIVEQDGAVVRRETVSRDSYEPAPPSQRPKRREPRESRPG